CPVVPFDNEKVSVVHVFNADNGKLVMRFFSPNDREYHLNDLILTNEGGAYITDTQSGHLFMVPPDLSELKLFMVDSLITVQNGITISPDNTLLYVEDDTNGIIVVDLNKNTIEPIRNVMSIFTGGIDGMVYYNQSIIGVVNSQYDFDYIVRYFLSDDGREIVAASIIDKANPEFITPTTCTLADNNLFVLAATCLSVYNRNQMEQPGMLKNPVVLKYGLSEK
ncbi:SMP-30/gluconolactonase/LRE family protein, partial [Bacteroidota bacterium]